MTNLGQIELVQAAVWNVVEKEDAKSQLNQEKQCL